MPKVNFTVLANTPIAPNKELVVSTNDTGEIVISTRIKYDDEGIERFLYEKGSIIVRSQHISNFKEFINELNEKVKKI